MFEKIVSLKKILGDKIFYAVVATFFLSFISTLVEILGIGFLAVFAVSLAQPEIMINKVPFDNLRIYLLSLEFLDLIILIAITIIITFFLKHLITFSIYFFEIKIVKKLNLKIKQKLFKNFLDRNYEIFMSKNKSEITNIVTHQTNGFVNYLYNFFTICKEFLLISIIFVGMLLVNWKLILSLMFILVLLLFLFSKTFKKKLNDIGYRARALQEQEIRHLNESYESIKFIKLSNKRNFFMNLLTNINNKKNRYEIMHFLIGKLPKIYSELTIIILFMIFVIFMLLQNESSNSIYGVITFLAFSIIRLLPSFILVNNSYTSLSFYKTSFDIIINEASILTSEIKDKNLKEEKADHELKNINFKNVNFSYQNSEKSTLKNISFSINEKDRLGIIGSSGCGKSTILNLMCGLLEPSKGKILFNDIDLTENKMLLKEKVSYVSQDTYLLDKSFKSNITLGDNEKDIDYSKLEKSIEISNLKDLIESSKENLNKIVGDGGSKISHGQRQRIGIARALYSNPDLLIIDEGLNALDYENEEDILKKITFGHSGMIVFVSHRIESLRYCNKLLIIDSGKIIDFGLKDELIDKHKDLQKYFQI